MNRAEAERFMNVAIEQGQKGALLNEVPVGAAVFKNGILLAGAHNRTVLNNDLTSHAELLCMQEAARKNGGRLEDCTLYVTLEPCAMCFGAAINLRLSNLVFGAYDPISGACGSACDLNGMGLHRINVVGGILESPCRKLLSDFFSGKRCVTDEPSV